MQLTRRATLKIAGLATVAALALPVASQANDTVQYNMSWLPQGSQIGVIVAIDKGYYEEVGIAVEPVRGYGGIRTVNEIDQGMFEFGYGNPLGVILNRAEGGQTLMVGSINDTWPGGLCFVTERHSVESPEDLAGMTVGGGAGSPVQVMLPAWLEMNGVDPNSVNLLQMDPAVVDASLIEGQIDAAECWLGSNRPLLEERAREADVEIGWIRYSDYQMDIYGSGVVTTEQIVEENPELVRRFLEATYRGYASALEDPEEATDIMLQHYPELGREVTYQQIVETNELIKAPEGSLGWMERDKMERTLGFLADAYDLAGTVSLDEIYTTEFLTQ